MVINLLDMPNPKRLLLLILTGLSLLSYALIEDDHIRESITLFITITTFIILVFSEDTEEL